ncbi:cell division protein ZapA [Allopontixanthobacter sp.]|uniref:cell division protein ZapA n=1 Tax=Allopontixanthobacter sp. TaxID=2906452 RepID=UPI002ABCEC35|nr:cell division protein ZapA [Allopontixanthobacter sp.]MDZ4307942.1 cell division protein ZapA [Allopontixanthobacter sp.]
MSQVTLTIGGRRHTVACADGEEAHIAELGRMIDEKFAELGNPPGPDSQNLLFAALLLADELHEARRAVLEAERTRQILAAERDSLAERNEELLASPAPETGSGRSENEGELAEELERFADLLENCADKLETKAPKD